MQNLHAESMIMLERARALCSGALPVFAASGVEAIKAGQYDIALEAANELAEKSTVPAGAEATHPPARLVKLRYSAFPP